MADEPAGENYCTSAIIVATTSASSDTPEVIAPDFVGPVLATTSGAVTAVAVTAPQVGEGKGQPKHHSVTHACHGRRGDCKNFLYGAREESRSTSTHEDWQQLTSTEGQVSYR